jgi:hypothetical protein
MALHSFHWRPFDVGPINDRFLNPYLRRIVSGLVIMFSILISGCHSCEVQAAALSSLNVIYNVYFGDDIQSVNY